MLTCFMSRCFIGWLSLPGERRCELCPSADFQDNCPLPGPHLAEKPSHGGLPRYGFTNQNLVQHSGFALSQLKYEFW